MSRIINVPIVYHKSKVCFIRIDKMVNCLMYRQEANLSTINGYCILSHLTEQLAVSLASFDFGFAFKCFRFYTILKREHRNMKI